MSNWFRIIVCICLTVALAAPAFAAKAKEKRTAVRQATDSAYEGGAKVIGTTEGIVTGCLKNTFSLFNPCLDFVKRCSSVVLSPIEKPFDYLEQKIDEKWSGKKAAKPVKPGAQKKQ